MMWRKLNCVGDSFACHFGDVHLFAWIVFRRMIEIPPISRLFAIKDVDMLAGY